MLHSADPNLDNESPVAHRPEQRQNIVARVEALKQLDSLSDLPEAELHQVAPFCMLRAFESGQVIHAERSFARTLQIVFQGSISLSRDDEAGRHVLLALLGRGDVFGEGGLFGSRYRRITARAESRTLLLQIAYDRLKPLLPSLPKFNLQLQRSYRERLLQTTLARVPLFSGLMALERLAIAEDLEEHFFGRGYLEPRASSEHHPTLDGLHIIAEGQAIVEREGRQVAVLNPGDFFGEMELLQIDVATADIYALTPLHILTVPHTSCMRLLSTYPSIADTMSDIVRARLAEGHDTEHTAVTEAAIKTGVVRGRKILARIPELCPPGCNLCEQACARRHSVSRIKLNGTSIHKFDVPTICMQCVWGAECAEACPVDAIHMDDMGHVFVNDRCTGCSACVEACPYDAITMIPLYPTPSGSLARLFQRVRQPAPLRLDANKCDGCHGFSDQACLSICPTGSLRWIDADDLYEQL